ncbi:hypothetical protein [Angustibacter luteus]|uniref:Uncharacterized protein n=1 Tax=Angustibacter luteus TaxID=658456 RepID=A0ABW1JA94_9ACTN
MFGRRRAALRDPRAEYEAHRLDVLTRTPQAVDWTPTPRLPDVWAAVVETGLPWGGSTLVALAGGSAELFTSTGKHSSGGGAADVDVRAAVIGLLLVLQSRLEDLEPTDSLALPGAGYVAMRALTRQGQRVVVAGERPLVDGIHPLSTVHFAALEVVHQLTAHDPA